MGKVLKVADKSTIFIETERVFRHPLYQKVIRLKKKYAVHVEDSSNFLGSPVEVGQPVKIVSCAPKSKTKKWELLERLS